MFISDAAADFSGVQNGQRTDLLHEVKYAYSEDHDKFVQSEHSGFSQSLRNAWGVSEEGGGFFEVIKDLSVDVFPASLIIKQPDSVIENVSDGLRRGLGLAYEADGLIEQISWFLRAA